MKLPIIIESPNFQFAIVGPTGINEGVIVKSNQSNNDLIGYANLIYTNNEIAGQRFNYGNSGYYHCWSDYISFYFDKSQVNVENRQFKVLTVWSEKNSYSNINSEIEKLINRIIFDIYKLAFDENLTSETKINNISWLISPIIFLGSQSNR
ncbi:hypothetical protein Aeqsu_0344 [Aequorivita sublithincola DSM 14238]|uniref:Uncharacterized protein n=1 Tax=Aequorivita sublithincola (strain DSM 14238 / LMG 21431 / ACAM 643 / 9-3) TaxID=746697 RepID=I3YS90_AEQSU|nr:hypothetical protein [Aequorivita sublithincola]AFL79858.1 hypothetical protein Aeqsu_0344 [Aequorivita sublithincola DSM 14238]